MKPHDQLSNGGVLPTLDLWADVPFDHLPRPLVEAFDREDWSAVHHELRAVMDSVVTDGIYGRELLTLVLRLPIGIDPLFDRYRAMASLDFGDWDGLQACLDAGAADPIEIAGLRDILLAPLGQTAIPHWVEQHHKVFFDGWQCQFNQDIRGYKRHAATLRGFRPVGQWARGDMPLGRHVRYRQLYDAFWTGVAESQGGRLPVAIACAQEAQHLGDEGEPIRVAAADLERLAGAAVGDAIPESVAIWDSIPRSNGVSPLAAWQMVMFLIPLVAACGMRALGSGAAIAAHVASQLGSPRAHLQAECWKIAAKIALDDGSRPLQLTAVATQARRAVLGLRALPQLLMARSSREPDDFKLAERSARRSGNVWVQVSALLWATALNPSVHEGRRLHQLLEITGWRRGALVPPEIAAEAALGLVSVGRRGRAVIELAAVAGRANVMVEVARRHLEEPLIRVEDKFEAVDAVAALATTHAQDLLRATAARRDEVGARAATLLAVPSHPWGLSEREIEVLRMAGAGLTNRQIAERFSLSPHTVARHLANARSKLGAANRAEAATRLAELRDR